MMLVRRRVLWRAFAWVAAAAVLGASLAPLPTFTGMPPPGTDKFVHLAMYATLMYVFVRAYNGYSMVGLGLALLCYGAAIEGLQHLLPHRTGSFDDAIANGVGVLLVAGAQEFWPAQSTP
jgi:hypothetical protein